MRLPRAPYQEHPDRQHHGGGPPGEPVPGGAASADGEIARADHLTPDRHPVQLRFDLLGAGVVQGQNPTPVTGRAVGLDARQDGDRPTFDVGRSMSRSKLATATSAHPIGSGR
jgi:hypothetical protein